MSQADRHRTAKPKHSTEYPSCRAPRYSILVDRSEALPSSALAPPPAGRPDCRSRIIQNQQSYIALAPADQLPYGWPAGQRTSRGTQDRQVLGWLQSRLRIATRHQNINMPDHGSQSLYAGIAEVCNAGGSATKGLGAHPCVPPCLMVREANLDNLVREERPQGHPCASDGQLRRTGRNLWDDVEVRLVADHAKAKNGGSHAPSIKQIRNKRRRNWHLGLQRTGQQRDRKE